MTYREKYKQLYPEEDASSVHIKFCPDLRAHDTPWSHCPCGGFSPYLRACGACWDREIPDTEAEPEKTAGGEPTARILIEDIGDTIHMEADGDVDSLMLSVLATDSDEFRLSAESKLAAKKISHGIQKVFNPLAGI